MWKCKCFIVLFVGISVVTSVDTTWHAPLRVVIVHTHRLGVYDATPDMTEQTTETGDSDDGVEA